MDVDPAIQSMVDPAITSMSDPAIIADPAIVASNEKEQPAKS